MRNLLDPDREVVTRKSNTRASVPRDWDDPFFNLFTGINWSATLLPATTEHSFEDCICTLSC